MELGDEGVCFACGPNNPIGLKLDFALEGDHYVARFTPKPEHQGYTGIMHGGLVGTLLDEAMAKLVYTLGHHALTARLEVTMRKPAEIGQELTIRGWITSDSRRAIDCAAEVRNAEGMLIAEATSRLLRV